MHFNTLQRQQPPENQHMCEGEQLPEERAGLRSTQFTTGSGIF